MAITCVETEQRMILGRRLLGEDVERGARDLAASDRVRERRLVDDAAARAVHDPHALLHLRRTPSAPTRPRVSAVSGVCTEMKSARA